MVCQRRHSHPAAVADRGDRLSRRTRRGPVAGAARSAPSSASALVPFGTIATAGTALFPVPDAVVQRSESKLTVWDVVLKPTHAGDHVGFGRDLPSHRSCLYRGSIACMRGPVEPKTSRAIRRPPIRRIDDVVFFLGSWDWASPAPSPSSTRCGWRAARPTAAARPAKPAFRSRMSRLIPGVSNFHLGAWVYIPSSLRRCL